MFVDKGLLFKALGLCGLCAGSAVLYFKGGDLKALLSSGSGKKKMWEGLECGEPTPQGGNCELKKKIFVKRGSTSSFELTTLGEGKIKVYKVDGSEGENTYQDGFKFLIEDNDIAGTDPNKLEEFESYEIKLGTNTDEDTLKGKHFLSRKTESKEEIKKALGLPWDLPDNSSQNQENINTENLKNIKFDGKTGATISGGTVTLTISKETSKTEFPLGYKFTFKNTNETQDATLTFGDTSITLKKNSPVEFKIKKEGSSLSLEKAWTLEELTKKVGLKKDGDEYWDVGGSGINIKLNDSTKKNKITKYSDSEGRIKVYSDQAEYNEGLKFTIEKGDLKLMEYNSQGNTSEFYLGQFQSFEIVKEENTWYLSKKDEALEKVKEALGLKCDLPTETTTSKECTLTNDNTGTIKFDGATSGTVTVTGSPKLTINKENGRADYPLGYKFTFSSTTDSTINLPSGSTPASIPLKNNLSYEYKIKRSGADNQTLSLERAWTPKILMERAIGFAEGNKENGWIMGGEGISIKQDTHKASSAKASGEQKAKIKVYEEVPGYNQGMKFVVEEGDTNLTNGGGSINKLSKYETYEVSKDESDKQWYFNRKKKSDESIRELLGIPQDCSMPSNGSPTECTLDSTKLNIVKFDGKGNSASTTITDSGSSVKLKISKETDTTTFPLGYKFTFTSDQHGFTVPLTSSSPSTLTIKKNTNTEFKIKETGSTLTLEKAWTAESLGKRVKLSCTGNENKCSFGDNINVWDAENNYVDEASITNSSSKTLTYELDQEGYNQGIKFSVDGESDIAISGSTGSASTKPTKICKKNGSDGTGETIYQIMEKSAGNSTKWYLVKKSN